MRSTVRAHARRFAATLSLATLVFSGCSTGSPASPSAPPSPTLTPATPSPGAPREAGAAPPPSSSGPASTSTSPEDTTPRVAFVGRFDLRDRRGPACAWPGCRIDARFEGTRVSVRLAERADPWMLGGPSEWDVAIDGVWQPKLVLETGEHDYVLAHDLRPGEHTVELYKRSEAQNGVTQFLGYDFGDGELLAPPPRATRGIEIIGDSQPAAFGVDGVGLGPDCPGLDYAAHYQNFRESFGAVLGETFHADVYGTVYSGKGLVRNIWRPDPDTMGVIFPRANPIDPDSTWDFSTFIPDVVVVMLGGNDFAIGQPADNGPTPEDEFTRAFAGLVTTIRDHYPEAHVLLATSPSAFDAEPAGRFTRTNILQAIEAVTAERNARGDARVYAVTPAVATKDELVGCDGHGSPAFHRRVAGELAQVIRARVGWP